MTQLDTASAGTPEAEPVPPTLWAEVRSSALLFLLAVLTTGVAAVLIEFSARELG